MTLVCELLSAFFTAASKYLATVSVCHSFTETVFHLSVSFFGLISSFHFSLLHSIYSGSIYEEVVEVVVNLKPVFYKLTTRQLHIALYKKSQKKSIPKQKTKYLII